MHQLTKDPSSIVLAGAIATGSSPRAPMSRFELTRYLDYCSEMLSLTSKLAALYAQNLPDAVIIDAVNDIEQLDHEPEPEDLAEDHDPRCRRRMTTREPPHLARSAESPPVPDSGRRSNVAAKPGRIDLYRDRRAT